MGICTRKKGEKKDGNMEEGRIGRKEDREESKNYI